MAVDNPLEPADPGVTMPDISPGMNKLPPMAGRAVRGLGMSEDERTELLQRARKRFSRAASAESDNRKLGAEDDRFTVGEQWPDEEREKRALERRPCLTINKLPTIIHQVTNDHRQNMPMIEVNPVGERANIEVAKIFDGMIREIQRESHAEIAFGTSDESTVRKGWGYWRIVTEYEAPDSFDQVVRIVRVRNANTVYLDPMHQQPDGSDAKWGFITTLVDREDFREDYPGANQMPWPLGGIGDSLKDWVHKSQIRIAEYFEVTTERRKLVALSNGHVGWKDELADSALRHYDVLAERESECPKVTWYKITAVEVLDRQDWPGQWLPIVKQIGDEVDIDGKPIYSGIVRNAKDAQRQYNYWRTLETEQLALAPKAKYIVAEGQIEGYEQEWRMANTSPSPVLFYRPISIGGQAAPPPRREPAAEVPQGAVNAAMGSSQDMMATTGVRFDASPHEHLYDESGRALRELRRAGDVGSFHYIDNLARSMRHTGDILIDLICRIYDRRRTVVIVREDDSEEQIVVDPHAPQALADGRDPNTGKPIRIFNPRIGRYGVTVTIGPSYATRRIEAAESMMDFVRALPQEAAKFPDIIARNLDWPGAQEIAARLAKTLPPNLLTPEQKDMPPQAAALMQAMQQQLRQLAQQNQQLMRALTDQQADRAQRQDKIDKDFEAKLAGFVQKAEATYQQHVGSQLKDLAEGIKMLSQSLASGAPAALSEGM